MIPRSLPWVTEWTPFPKNRDTESSLEKSCVWGVLYLRCLETANRRCFARSWIQEAEVQRVQDWRCRCGKYTNQNKSEKNFTLLRLRTADGEGRGSAYDQVRSLWHERSNKGSLRQQVFLWVGAEANAAEKRGALTAAQEYLHTHPGGRDTSTPILIVKQGFEPPIFTGWFLAWDPHMWSVRTENQGDVLTARVLGSDSSG